MIITVITLVKCRLVINLITVISPICFSIGKVLNSDDPLSNVSVAKVIFEDAAQNVKEDSDLFFRMYQAATQYNFSLNFSKEIKK